MTRVAYKFADANGTRVFYREAGDSKNPTFLLLHGFPSSSHQYRELIPLLARWYHVVAPDLPGFGHTELPEGHGRTFDALAETIGAFTEAIGLERFAIYVFDYGAPTGLRLALRHPDRVVALVTQNGNAYEEGLGDAWAPIRAYWASGSDADREAVAAAILTYEGTRFQYVHGVPEEELEGLSPDGYDSDWHFLQRPGQKDYQLDLFYDYRNNLRLYPDFQAYFRERRPPTLAIWGRHDPFFVPPGAEAFKRDNPDAIVELLETGHFALETHVAHIAQRIRDVFGDRL